MIKLIRKLFSRGQEGGKPEPAQIQDTLWQELLSIPAKELPRDNEFYRQCSDISAMPAFTEVIDAMIAEQMEAAIVNSTDNQHFRQYLSSVLGIRRVRERFRELSAAMKEQEEPFNRFEPI